MPLILSKNILNWLRTDSWTNQGFMKVPRLIFPKCLNLYFVSERSYNFSSADLIRNNAKFQDYISWKNNKKFAEWADYMTFHAMQINSSILGNFQIMSNLKIWQDYLHNLESQSFLALALAFHLPNTKSTILSDTKELQRNMLLHLTTLLQSMLMPLTLANNDIQKSAIIYLSLLKLHSKFRINSRFKGKMHT